MMFLDRIKRHQYLLLWGLVIVLSIALGLMSWALFDHKKIPKKSSIHKKQLTTGTSRINPQEVWVHDVNLKETVTQKRLEAIEKTLDQLLKINAPAPKEIFVAPNQEADLKKTISEAIHKSFSGSGNQLPPPPGDLSVNEKILEKSSKIFKPSSGLKKVSLNLRHDQHKFLKTVDNSIPAGAFARAILLGGVDASTSIQASSDPRPILLRLIDPGSLPRRFKSDLEGCHILAASFGDLSSERVYMRLEKFGCIERTTGEVMEMNVQGYVAGEDGRAGLRGTVVDRAGATMRNAMVGGFFSSIGKFLGQARAPLLFSPSTGLAQNNPLNTEDIFKQSAASGMSGALDKYADFYIKRAEQMQPIIQVAAGRQVDIVFTQGVDITDSAIRQALSKTHDQKRYQAVQNLTETKTESTAWLSNQLENE